MADGTAPFSWQGMPLPGHAPPYAWPERPPVQTDPSRITPILGQAMPRPATAVMPRCFDSERTLATGRKQQISVGTRGTFIRLEGNDQRSQIFTVHIGYVDALNFFAIGLPASTLISLVGTVSWGTGGGSQFAEFDVGRGTFLCLQGSFLQIDIDYQSIPDFVSPDVILSTTWGYETKGTTGIQGHITRTHHFLNLDPDTAGPWQRIPPYAVSVTVDTSTGNGARIEMANTPTGQLIISSLNANVPIVPGTQYYRIVNNTEDNIGASARFILAI